MLNVPETFDSQKVLNHRKSVLKTFDLDKLNAEQTDGMAKIKAVEAVKKRI